jgi:dephospho-CoA kinase
VSSSAQRRRATDGGPRYLNLDQDKSEAPLVLGLFGGIASGKSRVAALLAERGATILDADRLAHDELGSEEVRAEVVEALGPGVLSPEGAIDRRAVANVVFADPPRLRRLEGILHPRVLARFAGEIQRLREAGRAGGPRGVVVLDAPLLAEAGGLGMCDERLFVDAARETRLRRARERGWSDAELERREGRQLPLAEKRAAATYVIDNDGDLAATKAAVDRFWRERIAPRLTTG